VLVGVVILAALVTCLGTGAFVDGLRAVDTGSVLAARDRGGGPVRSQPAGCSARRGSTGK